MKLTTITDVSLDGATQGHRRIEAGTQNGTGPTPEEATGFERFGWAPPLLDDQASTFISQAFQRADAFLLGRRPIFERRQQEHVQVPLERLPLRRHEPTPTRGIGSYATFNGRLGCSCRLNRYEQQADGCFQ